MAADTTTDEDEYNYNLVLHPRELDFHALSSLLKAAATILLQLSGFLAYLSCSTLLTLIHFQGWVPKGSKRLLKVLLLNSRENQDVLVVENYVRSPDRVDRNTHLIHATEQFRIPAE